MSTGYNNVLVQSSEIDKKKTSTFPYLLQSIKKQNAIIVPYTKPFTKHTWWVMYVFKFNCKYCSANEFRGSLIGSV